MTDAGLVIAGAGVGGLCAALALAKKGVAATVLERATTIEPIGAGLQLSPNAMYVLAQLGLGDALREKAVRPECVQLMSARTGKKIASVPLGDFAESRYGSPYLSIHRADLQNILLKAVARHRDLIEVKLGVEVRDADQNADGVAIGLSTAAGTERMQASGLIGADGVWSNVRRLVMGIRQAAFTHRTAYRALIPIESVPVEWRKCVGLWLGKDAHVVHYPVSGGRMFNLVAVINETWEEESWSSKTETANLLTRYDQWPDAIRSILTLPESYLKWALCASEPGAIWVDGRVALLGDAAHAMLPFAAQGAAMAIEDAALLADAFSVTDNVAIALSGYETSRRERVDRVMKLANTNDGVYHMGFPVSLARDMVLRLSQPKNLLARLDWLYGWKSI